MNYLWTVVMRRRRRGLEFGGHCWRLKVGRLWVIIGQADRISTITIYADEIVICSVGRPFCCLISAPEKGTFLIFPPFS